MPIEVPGARKDNKNIMDSIKQYKQPLLSGVIGVVAGLLSKNLLKKDTVRVGTLMNSALSFGIIAGSGVAAMELVNRNIV